MKYIYGTLGEFGRFRRSRILSASEEKTLMDDKNEFKRNIGDDDVMNIVSEKNSEKVLMC